MMEHIDCILVQWCRLETSTNSTDLRLLIRTSSCGGMSDPLGHSAGERSRYAVLRAGAAVSNITPFLGTDLIGGFSPRGSIYIHDELHARCLVLDDGDTTLALVVVDLVGFHRSVSVEARRMIEESCESQYLYNRDRRS